MFYNNLRSYRIISNNLKFSVNTYKLINLNYLLVNPGLSSAISEDEGIIF